MHSNTAAPTVIENGWTGQRDRDGEVNGPSSAELAPLRLPISMPLSDARDALVRAGEVIALVTNRGVDVGVVTAEDLVAHGSTWAAVVGDVMGRELVCIDPRTNLRRTLRAYREAAWSSAIRRRPRPGEDRRREMADRQRRAASAVRDSVQRSALVLAAEVLDPDEDAQDEPRP